MVSQRKMVEGGSGAASSLFALLTHNVLPHTYTPHPQEAPEPGEFGTQVQKGKDKGQAEILGLREGGREGKSGRKTPSPGHTS